VGPTRVRLPGGESWIFRLVKIACNVAAPHGSEGNELPRLLRDWFGADAGAPGTGYKVGFELTPDGWTVAPVGVAAPAALPTRAQVALPRGKGKPAELLPCFIADVTEADRFVRYVPVYNLEAAAGSWGAEMSPQEIGWAAPRDVAIKPGLFIARVRGRSMEPKIKDGTWCLFRRNVTGSREGRIVLVQFNSSTDPDTGRFTIKRYHSVKSVNEDGWAHERIELRPLNPDYEQIVVGPDAAPEMLVVGEFVAALG
jgi:SOS-response transcriptional repressor LexA